MPAASASALQAVILARRCLVVVLALLVIGQVALLRTLLHRGQADQERASQQFVTGILRSQTAALRRMTLDYAMWDAAIANLTVKFNSDWADSNVGDYLFRQQDIDMVLLYDPGGRLAFSVMRGQMGVDPGPIGGGLPQMLAEARTIQPTQPAAIAGNLSLGPTLAIASAIPLAPEKPDAPPAGYRPGWILVMARFLSPERLAGWSADYGLRQLHLAQGAAGERIAALDIQGRDHRLLGHLAWSAGDEDGTDLFANAPTHGLALGAELALFALLFGLLGRAEAALRRGPADE